MKKIFVVLVILCMVGPVIYERFNSFMGNTEEPKIEEQVMSQQQMPRTADDIRKAAIKKERQL